MVGLIDDVQVDELVHDMDELMVSLLKQQTVAEIARDTMDFIERQGEGYAGTALDHMESMLEELHIAEEAHDPVAVEVLDRWGLWNYGPSPFAATA